MRGGAAPLVYAAYAAAILACAAGYWLDLPALRLAAKPVPVLLLAAWVARDAAPSPFRARFVFGLLFCALGDLVLETGRFVPGLVAFLVGHLGYLAAFLGETREPHLARALPFAAWGGVALALVWSGAGPLIVPVALYTATLCAMMWRATALVGPERPWARLVAAGAVIFAASDTMIAVNKFLAPFPLARLAILSTYWLGQVLLATGGVARR